MKKRKGSLILPLFPVPILFIFFILSILLDLWFDVLLLRVLRVLRGESGLA